MTSTAGEARRNDRDQAMVNRIGHGAGMGGACSHKAMSAFGSGLLAFGLFVWSAGTAPAVLIHLTEGKASVSLSHGQLSARFSKQPGITNFPDPTCTIGGATSLRVKTHAFDSGEIVLPCANWQRLGVKKYEYRDDAAVVSGVERITWSGVQLKIKISGGVASQFSGPVSFIEVRLTSGPITPPAPAPVLEQESYCARFTSFSANDPFTVSARGPAQACVVAATPTPTITNTPTITSTPTKSPTPTITPGGPTFTPTQTATITPTNTPPVPLGTHLFTLGAGSQVRLKGFLSPPAFALTGSLTAAFGTPDGNGVAPITIPMASVHFNPILNPIIGINAVCVKAVADGTGSIDCDGGSTGINQTISQDHMTQDVDPSCLMGIPDPDPTHVGVCNGQQLVSNTGTYGAGDAALALTVQITALTTVQFGPDNQPCTTDDQPPMPPSAVTIPVKTGTLSATIFDLNTSAGFTAALTAAGNEFNCNSIAGGSLTGGKLVGGFLVLHADPLLGDLTTALELVAQ